VTPVELILSFAFPALLILGVPIYVSLGLVGFACAFVLGTPVEVAAQSILN
jgi:C4-dicarboxylate transporter DctM subunit